MFHSFSGGIGGNDSRHLGMVVADFDGDGENELFIAVAGTANRILKWVNDKFVTITPPIIGDGSTHAKAAMAADIDGDGREELYVVNFSPYGGVVPVPDRLFSVQPDGSWAELFSNLSNPRLRNIDTAEAVAAIDRRGNGRYTFAVLNYSSPLRWYEIDASGRLVDLVHSLKLDITRGAKRGWVGPITSHRPDLILLDPDGCCMVFANQGDGQFLEEANSLKLDLDSQAGSMMVGIDANDDGRFHFALANLEEPHQLLIRQIDGTYKNQASWGMAMPSRCMGVVVADFDNDGYEELIFINNQEPSRGFRRKVDEQPTWKMFDLGDAVEATQTTTGAAIADIDSDGILELILAHGGVPRWPLTMHKVHDAGPNWVRVQPLTRFGAPARGATVHLHAGKRKQVRVIDGGGSHCSTEPIAHFGLGDVTTIDRIIITWPDGTKQTLNQPDARTLHRVAYPLG